MCSHRSLRRWRRRARRACLRLLQACLWLVYPLAAAHDLAVFAAFGLTGRRRLAALGAAVALAASLVLPLAVFAWAGPASGPPAAMQHTITFTIAIEYSWLSAARGLWQACTVVCTVGIVLVHKTASACLALALWWPSAMMTLVAISGVIHVTTDD